MVRADRKYERILHDFAKSVKLELDEKGLLSFMVCHAPEFRFHTEWLAKECGCSKGKMTRLLKDLREKGYITLNADKDKGKFKGQYFSINRELVIFKRSNDTDRHIQKKMYNEHIEEVPF